MAAWRFVSLSSCFWVSGEVWFAIMRARVQIRVSANLGWVLPPHTLILVRTKTRLTARWSDNSGPLVAVRAKPELVKKQYLTLQLTITTSHASIAWRKQLPPMNSGHHWHYMAKEHPFEGNYGASTNTHAKWNAMKTNSRKCQTAHARPLLEPAGFSQLVLVLDL